jgi:hypothetical protein
VTRTRVAISLLLFGIALVCFGGELRGLVPSIGGAAGPCDIVMVRETAEDTPEIGRLVVGLQSGDVAAYFESKGHELILVDDDAKDPNGNKAAILTAVEPQLSGLAPPQVVVIDRATRRVVHKQSVPAKATAAELLAALKGAGL